MRKAIIDPDELKDAAEEPTPDPDQAQESEGGKGF